MDLKKRFFTVGLAGSIAFGAMVPFAQASEEGRRNTALGLGALSAYLLARKQTTLGVVGLGATAYASKLYYDDMQNRHRRERAHAARHGFYRGYYAGRSSYGEGYGQRFRSHYRHVPHGHAYGWHRNHGW